MKLEEFLRNHPQWNGLHVIICDDGSLCVPPGPIATNTSTKYDDITETDATSIHFSMIDSPEM